MHNTTADEIREVLKKLTSRVSPEVMVSAARMLLCFSPFFMCPAPVLVPQRGFYEYLMSRVSTDFEEVVATGAIIPPQRQNHGLNKALLGFLWKLIVHPRAPLLRPAPTEAATEADDIGGVTDSGARTGMFCADPLPWRV